MSLALLVDVLGHRGDLRWQDDAACIPDRLPASVSRNDFFASVPYSKTTLPDSARKAAARARAVCRTCPVVVNCRDAVMGFPLSDRVGVWGGHLYLKYDKDRREMS